MIQIYHNPRCGKSRECLLQFESENQEVAIIKYLETPPSVTELKSLLGKLQMQPIDLVRKNEKIWVTKYKDQTLTDAEVIQAMADNPILIQRPIVINGDRAIIARPPNDAKSII